MCDQPPAGLSLTLLWTVNSRTGKLTLARLGPERGRTPLEALVHHSDRGSQYARRDCTELLHRDLAEAHAAIGEFLEKVYNQKRLYSALGYVPSAEFEAQLASQNQEAPARQLTL